MERGRIVLDEQLDDVEGGIGNGTMKDGVTAWLVGTGRAEAVAKFTIWSELGKPLAQRRASFERRSINFTTSRGACCRVAKPREVSPCSASTSKS